MNSQDLSPPQTHGCGSSAKTSLLENDEEKLRSPSPSSWTILSTQEHASQNNEVNCDCELVEDPTGVLAEHGKVSISENEKKDKLPAHPNDSHSYTMLPSNTSERLTSVKPTNKPTRRKRPLEGISDEEVAPNHSSQGPNSSSNPPKPKRLKPVPPNAPRDIKKCGIFTFRHGVRIIDYRLPTRNPTIASHSSQELRGCDGFDSPEAE